ADLERAPRGLLSRVLDAGDLALAPVVQLLRLGRVMAVTVDDHDASQDGRTLAQPLPNAMRTRHPVENPRCARANRQYGGPRHNFVSGDFQWPICRVSTRSSRRSKAASRP